MKIPLLLLSVLILNAARVSAAETNISTAIAMQPLEIHFNPETNLVHAVTINRPLDDVMAAMQTYYFSTNYHRFAMAVYRTNAAPGVSYTFKILDCAFDRNIGVFGGEMIATRINTNSTRLELLFTGPVPEDSNKMLSVELAMSRTLDHVSKLARKENVPISQTWP